MSRTVIQVEGLGKRYRIGQAKQHNALRNVIGDVLRAPVRLLGGNSNSAVATRMARCEQERERRLALHLGAEGRQLRS